MLKGSYINILSNKTRTVSYIEVTSNLESPVHDHKNGNGSQFTRRYKCHDLVYYKFYDHIMSAIEREKVLKRWNRKWKEQFILAFNPKLEDLWNDIQGFN